MRVSIDLTAEQADRLHAAAERYGVPVETLASAVLHDLLGRPDEDFERAAACTLRKNEELYRRLS